MSSEVEEKPLTRLPEVPVEFVQGPRRTPRYSYSRDFLLSLSGLEACKKPPKGFDPSLLSEFEDASNSSYEQQRNPGGSYFQSSKRAEYGPVQSNRLDTSNNYSRGSQGRWDTRSSGSSDREEFLGDRDSDSGRRFISQSRHSWQQSEQDSLLGKPSGYSGQDSVQKARGAGTYQLSKSSEPYQPPRPYKGLPFSRKDITDSVNDETFGSSACSSQNKAEEEKRRRASFEMMRKEQHKAMQEKKKLPEQENDSQDTDIVALLRKSGNAVSIKNKHNSKGEENVPAPILHSDSSRFSLHTQSSASRPLVPPGFTSATVEKNHPLSSSDTSPIEVKKIGVGEKFILSKESLTMDRIDSLFEKEGKTAVAGHSCAPPHSSHKDPISIVDSKNKTASSILSLEISSSLPGHLPSESSALLGICEGCKNETGDFTNEEAGKTGKPHTVSQKDPPSILDKLFQSALTTNDGGSPKLELQGFTTDEEMTNPLPSLSSKFSGWFQDENKKHVEDLSSKSLLSLIVSSKKAGGQPSSNSGVKFKENNISIENMNSADNFFTASIDLSRANKSESHFPFGVSDTSSSILTCEDLEHSILAEVNAGGSILQDPRSWGALNPKSEPLKANMDNNASHDILSLLHRAANSKDSTTSFNRDNLGSSECDTFGGRLNKSDKDIDCANSVRTGTVTKSDTLEALFGTDFMKELQSAEAPLSVQRSLAETVNTNIHPTELLPSDTAAVSFRSDALEESNMSGYYNPEVKSHRDMGAWQRVESLQLRAANVANIMHFDEGSSDIQLPEEESLIFGGDAMNSLVLPGESATKSEKPLKFRAQDNIVDKITALNSMRSNERTSLLTGTDGIHSVHRPFDRIGSDPSFSQLFGRPSSPQFHQHQISHTRPPFQQLNSHAHINSPMNFIGHDQIHRESHHPFSHNMIHHHSFQTTGGTGFEPASHLQMPRHMPMPGNFSLHQVHDHPRVPPSLPINHIPPYLPEINSMHGFPLNNYPASYRGVPMGLSGNGGINPPEALERLIEMELRANSKQNHPIAGRRTSGIYSSDIDMGFRYR